MADRPPAPTGAARTDPRRVAGLTMFALAMLALVVWLLSPQSSSGTTVTPPANDHPTGEGSDAPQVAPPPPLPSVPARNALAFARQINRAEAAIQDRSSSDERLAAAGRFEQLATASLRSRPLRVQRRIVAALTPRARRSMGAKLRAASSLGSLTRPERTLPRWRIIRPQSPQQLLRHYRAAQRASGVPWQYLAAINLVETRMGRIRGTSSAGAQGPMQFMPGTWAMYGEGGNVNDPRDAIMAAARLLRSNGAPRRIDEALWRYNNSSYYVRAVRSYAEHMRADPRAYFGYYHWQVLYRHTRGTLLLPEGYPRARPQRVGPA